MGIVQVEVILGGNFFWWGFSGWDLSGGNHPSGNFPGGSFPSTSLSIKIAKKTDFYTNQFLCE